MGRVVSHLARLALPALLVGVVTTTAESRPSSVPSAANSTVPATLTTCPAGHIAFTVTVRDVGNVPVANSFVVVDFCGAPGIDVCQTPGCTFSGTTNSSGVVVLNIPSGGVTASPLVVIKADGVTLATRAVASTDQTGDTQVTSADVAAITALLGTSDKRGDLDGDGVVTSADVAYLQAHLGHACAGPVQVTPRTWGVVKILYR